MITNEQINSIVNNKSRKALWFPSIYKWNHPHIMKMCRILLKTNRGLSIMGDNVSRLLLKNHSHSPNTGIL